MRVDKPIQVSFVARSKSSTEEEEEDRGVKSTLSYIHLVDVIVLLLLLLLCLPRFADWTSSCFISFSPPALPFDFLANNANWHPIVFEIGDIQFNGEGERRRVCDRICSGGGHCRRRRRWTVHRFPGVAAASKKVAEVGGGGMEKELKSLSEPAREIKDFQAIEQLNSRESGHFTPLEPVLTAVSGWREGGMDGCVRGQI